MRKFIWLITIGNKLEITRKLFEKIQAKFECFIDRPIENEPDKEVKDSL